MGKLLIIGIGGVTCGGKTTLSKYLNEQLPESEVLSQDDFYWPDDSEHHIYDEYPDYANFDVLSAFDMDSMVKCVQEKKKEAEFSPGIKILIIEGVLIYNHSGLAPLFDKKFFITLPKEECLRRRKLRDYLPPTPPGYFDRLAWPMYLKHKSDIMDQRDIVFLDGTLQEEILKQTIRNEVTELIETEQFRQNAD